MINISQILDFDLIIELKKENYTISLKLCSYFIDQFVRLYWNFHYAPPNNNCPITVTNIFDTNKDSNVVTLSINS